MFHPSYLFGTMMSQRTYSIRTRIKTAFGQASRCPSSPCQRTYSIRTRIKTHQPCYDCQSLRCQRTYSIRTRIKTQVEIIEEQGFKHVREHIPLEQGLRLRKNDIAAPIHICQRTYSIRTRIKTQSTYIAIYHHMICQRTYSIRTRIKTCDYAINGSNIQPVREHIPLVPSINIVSLLIDGHLERVLSCRE